MKPVTIPCDFYIACTLKDVDLYLERVTHFFISNTITSRTRPKLSKINQKLSNTLRLCFWQTCPKKQVCLYQWCYIISCNENDNGNGIYIYIYIYRPEEILSTNYYHRFIIGLSFLGFNKYNWGLDGAWGAVSPQWGSKGGKLVEY